MEKNCEYCDVHKHHEHEHEHHEHHHEHHHHEEGEVEEYGISTFVYKRREPMDRKKFFEYI